MDPGVQLAVVPAQPAKSPRPSSMPVAAALNDDRASLERLTATGFP